MNLVDSLKWRYATKQFDAKKKISHDNLDTLKEAVRLSASSYGLQPYKVLVIENAELREKLLPASYGQKQIVDASQVFVFCSFTKVGEQDVDGLLELTANANKVPKESLDEYGNMMKSKVASLSEDATRVWTAKQTYIGLANLMAAAAELKIDSCPMEGFDAQQYDEILGLKEKGLTASVIATVGYRAAEDKYQFANKVRKPIDELVEMV